MPKENSEWKNTILQILNSAARRARQIGAARTGCWVDLDKVPTDPVTCDAFSRAVERGWKAFMTWKPDRGMTLEAWIDAQLYGHASVDFFDHPLSMSKTIVYDLLRAIGSGLGEYEQRSLFEEMGHDPLDFDTIQMVGRAESRDYGPDEYEEDSYDSYDSPDQSSSSAIEDEAIGRLFLTDDLDEAEKWVWHLRQAGFSNAEIVARIPAELLGDVADPVNKVTKIYRRAKDKAARFWQLP